MDGKAIKLLKYLDGSDKRFIIPVYQRNYSWKVENCRQLYDDLVKLIRKNRKLHFFTAWSVFTMVFRKNFLSLTDSSV